MNELGLAIKQLQRKYHISGRELSRCIGITASSLSQIVNGHAKPRQGTFTKLCEILVREEQDEKLLVDAFIRVKGDTPETGVIDPEVYEKAEHERAVRFLEAKAQSIAFKRSVARELDKAGINYQEDYCEGIYVTDFLIEHDGKRIALECKFNIQRDFEKTIRIAAILRERLGCESSFIVVPSDDNTMLELKLPKGNMIIVSSEIGKSIYED